MPSPKVADKTRYCACGEMTHDADGNKENPNTGLQYHKVTWDGNMGSLAERTVDGEIEPYNGVWFPEIEVGDTFTITKVFPMHRKNTHGIMGDMVRTSRSAVDDEGNQLPNDKLTIHLTSAGADSKEYLIQANGKKLYPNARKD